MGTVIRESQHERRQQDCATGPSSGMMFSEALAIIDWGANFRQRKYNALID